MNLNIAKYGTDHLVEPLVRTCATSCAKLISKLQNTKKALLAEFSQGRSQQDRMLQLALNEAEALAHETGFPFLVFPMLAREKVEAVAAWTQHQGEVRRSSFYRLAA